MSGHDIIIADLRRQLDRMREERDEARALLSDATGYVQVLTDDFNKVETERDEARDLARRRGDIQVRLQGEVREARADLERMREERDQLSERMEIVLRAGPSTSLAASVFDRCKRLTAELDEARAELARLRARLPSEEDLRVLRGVEWPPMTALDRNMIEDWLARQEDSDD